MSDATTLLGSGYLLVIHHVVSGSYCELKPNPDPSEKLSIH